MNDTTQSVEQTAYEKEWGLETDDPQTSSVDNEFSKQTSEVGDQPTSEAPNDSTEDTSSNDNQSSAESEVVDVWADSTEAQREAFRRAENEMTAANNRAKINSDKLAERGRELKALREKSAELQEAARPRTEFETEHEVYASDINTMIEQKLNERIPVQEELSEAEVDQNTYEAITSAHPTAGDIYNSDAMKTLLAEDPVFKHRGQPKLFSETLHSNDPADVIAALDYYKTLNHSEPSQDNGLSNMQTTQSRGGQHDMKHSSQLSDQEAYAREWLIDDD